MGEEVAESFAVSSVPSLAACETSHDSHEGIGRLFPWVPSRPKP